MYKIIKAKKEETNTIKLLFSKASDFLKNNNVNQWQNNYPSVEVLNDDINRDRLYVLKNDEEIIGVMSLLKDEESTYKKIFDGTWLSDNIYYTVHRITVKEKGKGISKYLFDYAINECIKDGISSLRIDTHIDNLVMQKALNKFGFVYCGVIYLNDGSKRIAFEKVINMNKEVYEKQRFGEERALYNKNNIVLKDCLFQGEEDGESALKECNSVLVEKTLFDLRYPIWHTDDISMHNIEMSINCRAPMWYSNNIRINNSKLNCVKGLRECSEINIVNSNVNSSEFAWKCKDIKVFDSSLTGEYMFLDCKNIYVENIEFNGKYSFQYVKDLVIKNSKIMTKDAFWHAENVVVMDSYIKGEYLAWYSKNVKFVNCTIEGTQPLCYCEGLILENCKMINCDLSFEYSDVEATIDGDVDSIKNPKRGHIECGKNTKLIFEDSKYDFDGDIKLV